MKDDRALVKDETIIRAYLKAYGMEPIIKTKEDLEEEELLNPKNRVRQTVRKLSLFTAEPHRKPCVGVQKGHRTLMHT